MTEAAGATSPDPGGQSGAAPPEPTPDPSGAGSPGQTFTQEQVARMLADEKRKASARFSDYDELKQKLATIESAGQSELERAQKAAQEAEAKAAAAAGQRDRYLIRSAVTAAAVRGGALDPDVVVALLADGMTVNDAGELEGDIDKLVADLLEAKPYLKNGNAPANHGSADGGAHGRAVTATPSGTMNDLLRKGR